jgi:hypothetical protein
METKNPDPRSPAAVKVEAVDRAVTQASAKISQVAGGMARKGEHRFEETAEKVGHSIKELATKALHSAQEATQRVVHGAKRAANASEHRREERADKAGPKHGAP